MAFSSNMELIRYYGRRDQYECQAGTLETTIRIGDTLEIRLGEKQYSMKEDGVCMLVVDKNLDRVADCAILREDEAGELKLSHVEEEENL